MTKDATQFRRASNERATRGVDALSRDVRPMILIRGLLGSALSDRGSGAVLWGAALSRLASPTTAEGLRVCMHPMERGVPLAGVRDGVETTGPIRGFRYAIPGLGAISRALGRPSIASLEPGDQTGSDKRRSIYSYDWRREISEHVAGLHRHVLERIERDEPASGRVDIVAHSMGGLMLEYYLRYGATPLPDDGSLPALTWAGAAYVRHAVIMGSPAGGAVAGVLTLAEGAKLVPIVGHRYRPPLLGTIASVYQLMPRASDGSVVVEGTGEPVDIYRVETWERFGWGLFGRGYDRFLRAVLPGMASGERLAVARDHLEKCLEKAKQFHRAIDRDEPFPGGTSVHVIAGEASPTVRTLSARPGVGRLRVLEHAPGDSVVTRASALRRCGEPGNPRPGYASVHAVGTRHRAMPGDVALARSIARLVRGRALRSSDDE